MFVLQLVGELDVLLLGLVLPDSLLTVPRVPLCLSLIARVFIRICYLTIKEGLKNRREGQTYFEVHHAGSAGVTVANGGLLVQGVHLQQLLVGQSFVDLVAHHVHGGLEVLLKTHCMESSSVLQMRMYITPGPDDSWCLV